MRAKNQFSVLTMLLLLFGLGSLIPQPAQAATFTVNSTLDAVDANPGNGVCADASGNCTLRAAVMETNALGGTNTIILPAIIPAGTVYTLSLTGANEDNAVSGDLDIRNNLTIRGDGSAVTSVDGNLTDRVFHTIGAVTVELIGLTITNGYVATGSGGGIYNSGAALYLTNCALTFNTAFDGDGAGIYNEINGALIAAGTTFLANAAGGNGGAVFNGDFFQSEANTYDANSGLNGGAIFSTDNGYLTVSQDSFLQNSTYGTGGGAIFNNGTLFTENSLFHQNFTAVGGHGGAIYNAGLPGSLTAFADLTNVTIGENTADGNGGGIYNSNPNFEGLLLINVTLNMNSAALGGGLFNDTGGQASLLNTLLANNAVGNCSGIITSLGTNLETADTCGFGPTDIINVIDPVLLDIAANGGPTLTYALDTGSPAINAGNPNSPPYTTSLTTDQRLFPRDATDGFIDIGAYEFGAESSASADLAISKTDSQDPVLIGTNFSYTITVTNNGPSQATGVTVTDTLPAGVTLISSWASQGTCSGTTAITCNLGALNPTFYPTATVILNVTAPGTAGPIDNTATVSATETDPVPANNSSTANTTIIGLNPVPSLTSINPTSAFAGGPTFSLTVVGSSFVAGSKVFWGTTELTPTSVSSTQLIVDIPAADIATAGTIDVTVFNPAPGGGTSTAATFTINNPTPVINTISPDAAVAGGPAFTLTVTGTEFVAGSIVFWEAMDLTPTSFSSTQLTVDIPAANIATAGTVNVRVFNPAPGGGTSTPSAVFTINNPAPAITMLSPGFAVAGGPAFSLSVTGTGFVAGSKVFWGTTELTPTSFSSTQLTVNIPAADIATAGTVNITVFNPAPGGGTSAAAVFFINNPVPAISTLSPSSTVVGGPDFTLTVNGSSFVPGAQVSFNNVARAATLVNAGQLTAAITAAEIATTGTVNVTVFNPAPGGGTSAAAVFTVNHPFPIITTISPDAAVAGGPAFSLTVTGTEFVAGSKVFWGTKELTTTSFSSTQLTVNIPAADIATAGTVNVTVVNPAPGGGTSAAAVFTINNPAPAITTLSPGSAVAGGPAFSLTVTGTEFVAGSKVFWGTKELTTTSFSSTQLTVNIPAADIATAGTVNVTVVNPAPGGGTSAAAVFFINNPVPAISTLSPSSAVVGGPDFTLTVNGSNFVPGAQVSFNNVARAATFVNAGQLTAAITAAEIATAGTVDVTVVNPAPGGGTSAAAVFTIGYQIHLPLILIIPANL